MIRRPPRSTLFPYTSSSDLPAHTMTVLTGARLIGEGALDFYGSNRMEMQGDVSEVLALHFYESSRLIGSRTLTLEGSQFLVGTYDAPVVLADNARSEERRVGKECRSRWSPYH